MKKTALALLLIIALSPLWAADIAITVLDADLGIPLEGVRLQGQGMEAATTGADGRAVVALADGQGRVAVTATLPGYETGKLWVKPGDRELTLKLSIAGVIEGKELVVEKAKPQKTDEQSGVSDVATQGQIESTGEIGIVEDVMSTIKLLPGVGYVGGWNAMPSIRGGDPSETTAALDGAYVLYPYQWGGAFSIFDPNMVESAKLSNGIISASYGNVLSGLLEVNSKTPSSPRPQIEVGLSTSGLDFYAQGAIAPGLDLMIGGKVTWLELTFALVGESAAYPIVPYIRNGYARISWKPSDDFEWFLNSFVGSDGVGISMDSPAGDSGIATTGSFNYSGLDLIETTGAKIMLSSKSLLDLTFSYNRENIQDSYGETLNGTHTYDPTFISANQGVFAQYAPGATSYTLNDFDVADATENTLVESYQGKANWDWEFLRGQVLSFGFESVLETTSERNDEMFWTDVYSSAGLPQFMQVNYQLDSPANAQLASGAYGVYDFDLLSGLVTGEAGIRADYSYLYNSDMSLSANPTFGPRLRVEVTPWKNIGWIESLGITAGTGLYSQMPLIANLFNSTMQISSGTISPTRAWFNVVGLDLHGEDDWKISLEAYYKLYFDRLYAVVDESVSPAPTIVRNDGQGYAYGADLLVQKNLGRYWDGWLTYSYSMARYYNPMQPQYPGEVTVATENQGNDPLGIWYYPSFQRFHTVNLVFDWKPKPGFMVTLTGSLATGAPRAQVGTIQSYASVYTNPATGQQQIIERYSQTDSYSDVLRNDTSCPLDIKLTWSGYYPGSEIRWEYYIGVENVFASLYSPSTNKAFDPFSGDYLSGSGQADFTLGFPIPSFGYKLSY